MGLRIDEHRVPDDPFGGSPGAASPLGGNLFPSGRSPIFAGPNVEQAAEERVRRRMEEDEIRKKLEEEQAETFLGKLGRTFGGPGYALLNLLRLRPGAAIKNLADTATGAVTLDPITGLGTRFASREEQPTVSEVLEDVGIGAPRHRGLRAGIDIVGGLFLDPLSRVALGGSSTARAIAMARGVKSLKKMPNWAGDLSTALSTTKAGRARWQDALDEASKVRPTFVGGPSGKVKIAKGADIEEEAARIVMKKMGQSADPEGYIATLQGLEESGDILKAGLRYDPWLIRAPLRALGLIEEGAMEPRLLSSLGGAFDETLANRGFWAGPAGKLLEKATGPGWAYQAAGRFAPKVQEAMRMPFDATIRKLFNPMHGKLRGIAKGDRGLLYRLEDAARASQELQYRNAKDFTAILNRVFGGFDPDTTKELKKSFEEVFGMKEMDDLIKTAYGDLRSPSGYSYSMGEVVKKGKKRKKREGLFFSRQVAEELGGGDLELGYGMMYDNLQSRVDDLITAKFDGIADRVVESRRGAAGWTAEQASEIRDDLVKLQDWIHKHHRKMLREAQDDWKMLATSKAEKAKRKPLPPHVLGPRLGGKAAKEKVEVGRRFGRIGLNFYMPTQMNTELSELIARSTGRGKGGQTFSASGAETAYEKFRETGSVEDFRKAIVDLAERAGITPSKVVTDPAKEDLFDLILRRQTAHNRAMTNKMFLEEAASIIGRRPGAEQSLAAWGGKLDDVRFEEFEFERLQSLLDNRGNLSPEEIRALEIAIDEQREVLKKVGGFTDEDLKSIRNIGQVEWPVEGAEAFVREALKGLGRRSEFGRQWDSVNHWLKQSMTVGIGGVPFLAFSTRNLMGGMVQALMDPSTSAADAVRPLLTLMHDFPLTRWMSAPFQTTKAKEVRLFRKALESAELRSPWVEDFDGVYARLLKNNNPSALALQELEKSGAKIAGLSPVEMYREIAANSIVGKDYAAVELFKQRIQDPKVLEQVRKALRGTSDDPPKNLPRDIWLAIKNNTLPRRIASAVEDTMRINSFLSMRSKGISAKNASERVNRIHVDYKFTSEFDRNLRSVFPFLAFRKGTLPVVMEQALTRPGTVTPLMKATHSMRGTEGELVPEWLSGKTALPIGLDKEGNMMFLTSFGLIHEDVDLLLSGFGDVRAAVTGKGVTPADWTRVAVGSALHPWLQGIVEYGTNRNLYFGTELGDYRRAPAWMTQLPGMEKALTASGLLTKETSKAGKDYYKVPRWFHPLLGLTPFNRLSTEIDRVLDERKGWASRVMESSSGIRIATVNQDRELRRQLGEWLKDQVRAGDVGKLEVFFGKGELPPEASEMLRHYNELLKGKTPKTKPVKPGPGVGSPDPVPNRNASAPQSQPLGPGLGPPPPTSLFGR